MSSGKKEKTGEKQTKIVISVMLIMLTGKVAGLYRGMLISGKYGTGNVVSEAFNYASQLPRTFLDVFFASAFTAGFIPVLSTYLEKKGEKAAYKLANNFISIMLLLSAAVTVLLAAAAPFIIRLNLLTNTDAGFVQEVMELATPLLRVMLPTIVLSVAAYAATGVLQSLNEFNAPAAMSLASNLLIIIYMIFFSDRLGVFGLAVTFLLGWGAQFLIQLPALHKKGFRFKFEPDLKEPGLKDIWRLMFPVMISSWAVPVNLAVNEAAAAEVAGGAALNTANMIYSVIAGVFVFSVTNVLFTRFSRLRASDKTAEMGESITSVSGTMLFILIPMSAGVFALAPSIVQLIFERGEFDAESTRVTAAALRYLAPGMAGFGLQNILSRGFYALKEVRVPLIASIIAIALNAVLSFSLVGSLGTGGPAIASSLSVTAASLIMLFSLIKKKIMKPAAGFAAGILKIFFLSITMAIIVLICYDFFTALLNADNSKISVAAATFLSVAAGIVWYFGGACFLRVREAEYLTDYIKKIINGGGRAS